MTNTFDNTESLADNPMSPSDNFIESEIIRIPRLEEQLRVSTQTVETGRVKLTKVVHETQETVAIPLLQEQYVVERIAINQYVEESPSPRKEGDTMIYPVLKEVLVIQKRLLLVEEIRVTRQQTHTQETQTVQLRREDIIVERTILNPERPV